VLWHDGLAWQVLPATDAAAFAALPARPGGGAPGGAAPLGTAPEEAGARSHAEARAADESRSLAAFDAARERGDRSAEDALAGPRRATEEAREAWTRARSLLHEPGGAVPERRAILERAEREYRRRLDALRGAETSKLEEKDRTLSELRRRAEVRGQRRLVATAWWRCA